MQAYLDNSATTKVDPEVMRIMEKVFLEDYGNPSSLHKMGFEAEGYVRAAVDSFSKLLKCSRKNIIFTSGGTESDNTAIIGTALFKESRGKHMITTTIEHPAVSEAFKFLEKRGWEIERLSVDENGYADPEELKANLREDTVLVSVMHVNNEIGTIEPVEEMGRIIKENAPECFFHVDDIQGFGKLKLYPGASGIDFLSVSSHKIHGPKGVGLNYISDRASHIPPMMMGGGQQDGMRSGTVNVPGIAGFARAAELMYEGMEENAGKLKELRSYFINAVSDIPDIKVNGPEDACPNIVSLTVRGIRAEVLLHALEDKDIFISAGSACSSNKAKRSSPTLEGIGLSGDDQGSTVRFSFGRYTIKKELEYTVEMMRELIPMLRRFKRR